MKHIYGPVRSRRLELSLGINLLPGKLCNFACIYCQLGAAVKKVALRQEYVLVADVLNDLKGWLAQHDNEAKQLKYITLSGSGEPTLHIRIKDVISGIKQICNIPVAVITNASLLSEKSVRQELLEADLIVPSLDAVDPDIFTAMNRPSEQIVLSSVVEGLVNLRKEFKGRIWLEVMVVKGINDSLGHMRKFKEIIEQVRPDKIQLNSPVRTTAEPDVLPVTRAKLEKIKVILGEKCEIV